VKNDGGGLYCRRYLFMKGKKQMGQQLYQELDDMRAQETRAQAIEFGVLSEVRGQANWEEYYHYNGWSYGTKTPSGRQVLIHEFEHKHNGRRVTFDEAVNSDRIQREYRKARK